MYVGDNDVLAVLLMASGALVVWGVMALIAIRIAGSVTYEYTHLGIDITVLGGRLRLCRIRRGSVRAAAVVRNPTVLQRNVPLLLLLSHPRLLSPFVMNIGFRGRNPILMVGTNNLITWILTPDNPESALRALGFGSSVSGG
jgi:hypothetical protein